MLFDSETFIFIFLPVALFVYQWFRHRAFFKASQWWLIVASFTFYGWWNPVYVLLLASSIAFNFLIGNSILRKRRRYERLATLTFGVTVNLCLLAYFKYANFFFETFSIEIGEDSIFFSIVLPLAISFFTFQQIAYLVDLYRKKSTKTTFRTYCLFVSFFPQLISGPIVHHKEMIPQFAGAKVRAASWEDLAVGITLFSIGLFKKVVIADGLGIYSDTGFAAAEESYALGFSDAWLTSLAFSMQIYFDFSGYSDMALGLGRMFGIVLPLNFFSPYQASSIIEFWHRWHITLSRFLRDYLYIPLGGNKKGIVRRDVNIVITMLLGGLWHGAGWGFVIWGGIHGVLLVINHHWRSVREKLRFTAVPTGVARVGAKYFTFLLVTLLWVFFRLEDSGTATRMILCMTHMDQMISLFDDAIRGLEIPGVQFFGTEVLVRPDEIHQVSLGFSTWSILFLMGAVVLALHLPNANQILSGNTPSLVPTRFKEKVYDNGSVKWRPSRIAILAVSILWAITYVASIRLPHAEFIYFQF